MPMTRRSIMMVLAPGLFLGGCDALLPPENGVERTLPLKPSLEQIRKETTGFSVGNSMAASRAYVFFDPSCPSCGMFWNEIKPLLKVMHFSWIPVGVLSPNSILQGAALLAAKDPQAEMEAHKTDLLQRKSGVDTTKVRGEFQKQIADVEQNMKVFQKLGVNSVPFTVGRPGSGGAVVELTGGKPAQFVAAKFGVQMPKP